MQDKWQELVKVLNQILSLYQAMLVLSRRKHKILVAAKSDQLEQVTKDEEVLILQVGQLEEKRRKLVSQLVTAYGLQPDSGSLSELQQVASSDIVEAMQTFSLEFGIIMEEIIPLNTLNTELIQQALVFINYNINLLSHTVAGSTYAAKGQSTEETRHRKLFDARV